MSMASWLSKHKPRKPFIVGLSVFCAFVAIGIVSCSQDTPLSADISLSTGHYFERAIWIRGWRDYEVELEFERTMTYVQAQQLVGAMGLCESKLMSRCSKGVPIPIRWSLRSVRGGVVAVSGESVTLDSSAWSDSYVARHVARVHVPVGRYVFRIESLRDVPEFAGIRTRVLMYEIVK